MDQLQNRQNAGDEILKNRFINRVLKEAGTDIDKAQRRYMSSRGFEKQDWYTDRSFTAQGNALDISHLKKHRFVDMRFRNTDKGKKKKGAHPIHNKIIWGHRNNIIRELTVGFTEAVKQKMRELGDENL